MTRAIKVTPDVMARLIWAANQPMTLEAIGNMVDLHPNTVSRVLKRAGIEREPSGQPKQIADDRVRELSERGASRNEIASTLRCSVRAVDRSRRRQGISETAAPRLSEDEIEQARALLDDGASVREVARTLGRSDRAIHNHFPGRAWSQRQIHEHLSMLRRLGGVL